MNRPGHPDQHTGWCGRDHAEIRVRVALAVTDTAARRQLAGLLVDVRQAVTRAAVAAHPRPGSSTP